MYKYHYEKKSLGINTLLNGLRSLLNVIFPLITFPYVSRILSVDGLGIYNFSNTYVSYFVLIAGLGIATYAVREGVRFRDDRVKISVFASQVFTINVISSFVAYALLILSLIIFKNLQNYVSTILIFSLQILFTTIGTEWVYTIYEDYSYITIRNIIFKIISIILLLIFVKGPTDYLWYAGITVFAGVGSNILNYIHAKSFIDIRLVRETNWRVHLKPIFVIFASSVATTLYVSSDVTILGLLKNDYAVGIYSVAVKIYNVISSLVTGLLTATVPRLSMLMRTKKLSEYNSVLSSVINNISILMLPTAVGAIMLSKEIILIIAGKKYMDSILSLQIIVVTLIFSTFSIIFNYCVLIPARRENLVLRNTIITGILNIILNFILIPIASYDGTALTTVLSEIVIMVLDGWSAKDIVKPIMTSRKNIKNIIDSLIGCFGIVVVCLLLKAGISSMFLRTILSVILSVGIYAAILVFLDNSVAVEFLGKLKNKVGK